MVDTGRPEGAKGISTAACPRSESRMAQFFQKLAVKIVTMLKFLLKELTDNLQ